MAEQLDPNPGISHLPDVHLQVEDPDIEVERSEIPLAKAFKGTAAVDYCPAVAGIPKQISFAAVILIAALFGVLLYYMAGRN